MAKKQSKKGEPEPEQSREDQTKGAIIVCIIVLQRLVLSPAVRLSAESLAEHDIRYLKNKMDSLWQLIKN